MRRSHPAPAPGDWDKDFRQLRDEGQSYSEIADELGRSRSDIARVCQTLNCAATNQTGAMLV